MSMYVCTRVSHLISFLYTIFILAATSSTIQKNRQGDFVLFSFNSSSNRKPNYNPNNMNTICLKYYIFVAATMFGIRVYTALSHVKLFRAYLFACSRAGDKYV